MNESNALQNTSPYSEAKRQDVIRRMLHASDRIVYCLEKDGAIYALPPLVENQPSTEEDHLELALAIDKTIDTFYNLVGQENTRMGFVPTYSAVAPMTSIPIQEKSFALKHSNRKYYELAHDKAVSYIADGEIQWRYWYYVDKDPGLITVRYTNNILPVLYPTEEFKNVAETLLGTEIEETYKVEDFETLTFEMIAAIDQLFARESIEPTAKNRANLLSLVFNSSTALLITPEITALTGMNKANHNVLNPNLLRLAAAGINDAIIKLCYVHHTYPEDLESLAVLANLPYQTLYHIWDIEWELPKAS